MDRSHAARKAFARLFALLGAVSLAIGCAHAKPISFEGGAGGDDSSGDPGHQHLSVSSSVASSSSESSSIESASSSVSVSSSTGSGCVFPEMDCGQGCIDTSGDPLNCGACFNACAAGETCGHGVCLSGGGACDGHNDCGTCLNCSINPGQACSAEADSCLNDADCNSLINCLQPCMDQACADACANQHPMGMQLYMALTDCAFCTGCAMDCKGQDPNCP